MGCRGGCQRIALFDKGKRRIQTDFGSHRPMRRVCAYQATHDSRERLKEDGLQRLSPEATSAARHPLHDP